MVSEQRSADEAEFHDYVAQTMHELNNVLSVVQLTADLLDRDAVPAAQASETIRQQVREAVQLVEELRRRARGTA